jgi:hypothetical protein
MVARCRGTGSSTGARSLATYRDSPVEPRKQPRLIARGLPYADVAKVVGCSRAMVYRIMAERMVAA